MRGNVGFPNGHWASEAGSRRRYHRHGARVPPPDLGGSRPRARGLSPLAELGEDRFPVFAAVPILGHPAARVVTMQRRGQVAFDASDIQLATALGASIGAFLRRADLLDALSNVRRRGVPWEADRAR